MSRVDQIWNEGMIKSLRDSLDAVTAERDALKSEVESLKKHAESLNEKMCFWHGEENKRSAEFFALKKRLDKGVRVWARSGAFNGIWADTVNYADRRNATLILDEDEKQ